jgi:3-keto-5-aminohexanoate cleavage enzyme
MVVAMNPVGLAVTLRVRMSAADANQSNGSVSPARILALFSDAATELMIRLDGDEGSLRALQQVELLAPVYVGDYIEATGVLTKIGNTTRQLAFEARKVATYARGEDLALTAADALASPILVCRAIGTAVVPKAQQRRPRLVLAALGTRKDSSRLPAGSVLVTPPPSIIVTPARQTPPEVMLAASILGGGVTKDHTPHIPATPEQAATEAKRCVDSGASIICLGVDDTSADAGTVASRMTDYVAAIRAVTQAVIVVSAIRPGTMDASSFLALADCGADILTASLGSFNFGDATVQTSRTVVREVTTGLRERGIPVMAEAYELGHFEEAMLLGRDRVLPAPLRLQFVFGVPGAIGAHETMLQFVSERIPKSALWFAAGVGRHQRRVTETAMRLGGHVRLGLADNIYHRRGVLAETSALFIERSASFALNIGRQPVSPDRARVLLSLVPPPTEADTFVAQDDSSTADAEPNVDAAENDQAPISSAEGNEADES